MLSLAGRAGWCPKGQEMTYGTVAAAAMGVTAPESSGQVVVRGSQPPHLRNCQEQPTCCSRAFTQPCSSGPVLPSAHAFDKLGVSSGDSAPCTADGCCCVCSEDGKSLMALLRKVAQSIFGPPESLLCLWLCLRLGFALKKGIFSQG